MGLLDLFKKNVQVETVKPPTGITKSDFLAQTTMLEMYTIQLAKKLYVFDADYKLNINEAFHILVAEKKFDEQKVDLFEKVEEYKQALWQIGYFDNVPAQFYDNLVQLNEYLKQAIANAS